MLNIEILLQGGKWSVSTNPKDMDISRENMTYADVSSALLSTDESTSLHTPLKLKRKFKKGSNILEKMNANKGNIYVYFLEIDVSQRKR